MHSKRKGLAQPVSVGSISVNEYDSPGIVLCRRKLTRCTFWNLWKEQFRKRIEERNALIEKHQTNSLLIFVENAKSVIQKRVFFDRWRRSAIRLPEPPNSPPETSKELSPACTKKYEEFALDLQNTAQSIARNQTQVEILDAKLKEMRELYDVTKEKAVSTQDAVSQASDKYDELLKMVSQKKVEHRDLVLRLKRKIERAKQEVIPSPSEDMKAQDRLAREHALFHNEMVALKAKFESTRQEAVELRLRLDESARLNSELEREIQKLTKEKQELGDVEHTELKSMQKGECLKLMRLLMKTDKQLKATAETLNDQNAQMKELDVQIIKRRKALLDMRAKNIQTKPRDRRVP